MIVNLKDVKFLVNDKTIRVSEKDVPFSTEYDVISSKTGDSMKFRFSHSTGPEFDPTTEWVYKSQEGIEFRVYNDPNLTAKNEIAYLRAKCGRVS